MTSLPRRCWSVDGNCVIFDSAWRSAKVYTRKILPEIKVGLVAQRKY